MIQVSVVIIVCCVCIVCLGYGIAVFRAFFARKADRVAYCMAGVWAAWFAVIIVGCLMLDDAFDNDVVAGFAALVAIVSHVLSFLFDRRLRNREMVAAVAYLQMYRATSFDKEGVSPSALREKSGASLSVSTTQGNRIDTLCATVARAYDLTRREEDVLKLLVEGSSMASVAQELVVSANTVKSHVRHIYRKMGVNRKQDLCDKVFEQNATML